MLGQETSTGAGGLPRAVGAASSSIRLYLAFIGAGFTKSGVGTPLSTASCPTGDGSRDRLVRHSFWPGWSSGQWLLPLTFHGKCLHLSDVAVVDAGITVCRRVGAASRVAACCCCFRARGEICLRTSTDKSRIEDPRAQHYRYCDDCALAKRVIPSHALRTVMPNRGRKVDLPT